MPCEPPVTITVFGVLAISGFPLLTRHTGEAGYDAFHQSKAGVTPLGELVDDHRSESLPDHRLGAAHHLIDDAGGAHQPLGLTDRFTGQQAHLFEVTCELRGWRKSTKPVHGKLLPIKTGSTNHRKLRIRNDLVWRRIVTPFPFPHDAVAQSASRSIGEFRAEDKMTCSILDASSDDPVLVLRMGVGLEARE